MGNRNFPHPLRMRPELGWQPSKEWHFLQVNCHKHYGQELQKQCCKGTFHYKELLQGDTKILFFLAFCKSKNSCSLLCNLTDISLFTNCFDQRHLREVEQRIDRKQTT